MTSEGLKSSKPRLTPFMQIGDLIARIAAPIRTKLLIAFLGIAALMIAMALTGIAELRNANLRTAGLVEDNFKFTTLNNVSRNIQLARIEGATIFANEQNYSTFMLPVHLDWATRDVRGNFPNIIEDAEIASTFLQEAQDIQELGNEVVSKYSEGDFVDAKAMFDNQLTRALRAFDRKVINLTFDLRRKMREKAKLNDVAYRNSRQLFLGASGLAVMLALFSGYLISTSVIRPVERIQGSLQSISAGDFTARADVVNRDELGDLAQSANKMAKQLGALYAEVETQRAELADWNLELEEKVKAQVAEIDRTNRLRRFLPAQVADLIVDTPDEEDVLRTQRAEVTVLFADLRDFTAFASAATPDQVVSALNTFHSACGPLVEASGGTLERFLGDGLMVLFGAPVPMEDAAQKAVDLAKQMRVSVGEAMTPFKIGAEGRHLGVGIGIGTGAATLGQIGFEGRRDYSAIGPAPNLAARLSDLAESGQILISHATAWQVESEMESAGPFDLKGIGQNVAAFELVARSQG